MDFMKVFDQTVREIKREVNLKVLKVPEIEQKVLDATDNEPWGPHGSALAEIAQATKKFTECQMVMSVLWTRLGETGKDWRYVYKALAVIEYLVSHGSERAVDDIIEHTFQISSLTSFEYVEPSGKDMGINVRKKAETIVTLLNDKEKIQEVRNKATANRDKYVGLSSTGVTYKSGSASYSGGSFQGGERYGVISGDRFKDSYREKDHDREEKIDKDSYGKSSKGFKSDDRANASKRNPARQDQYLMSSRTAKPLAKPGLADKSNPGSSESSKATLTANDDDFDDFDPRGTSSNKSATGSSNQVDLFGQSLIGDLLDAPISGPTETSVVNNNSVDVDLFADATFVSASHQVETGSSPQKQEEVDLFASQPTVVPATPTIDPFATPDPVMQPEVRPPKSDPTSANVVDPFAAIPLNSFDGSDMFGVFTSHSDPISTEPAQCPMKSSTVDNLTGNSSADSKPPPKKETFQLKSGIWADSLTRGLIDLNITAPKKVSLADVGVVGGLSDGSDERERGAPTSFYMGRAMGTGSGLGKTGFPTQETFSGDDFFSNLNGQKHQFGSFQK